MLVQIAGGSTLYPSVAGPIVLLAAAGFVAFGPRRWAAYVGLVVPLVLAIGAIVAAVMTGGFTSQLAAVAWTGIFVGSVMHVVGLSLAVAGGLAMLLRRRPVAEARA